MLFSACYNPLDDISASFGISMKGSVHLETVKRDESDGLNSDFTCVYVFSIKDRNLIIRAKELFQPYEFAETGTGDIAYPYLAKTSGYCQTLVSNAEAKRLYIDTVNNNVVYCITHL